MSSNSNVGLYCPSYPLDNFPLSKVKIQANLIGLERLSQIGVTLSINKRTYCIKFWKIFNLVGKAKKFGEITTTFSRVKFRIILLTFGPGCFIGLY